MEAATAQAAEGVTSEGTPAPEVESPTTEAGDQTEARPGEEEVLPFGKHPRWQKMVKERRELQAKLQQIEQQSQGNAQLFEFGNFLKSNPQIAKAVYETIEKLTKGEAEPKGDPYAEYDPDVAERFRKLDELQQWKADQERQRAEQENQSLQEYQASLDTEFDQRLMKDGFLAEDGTPKNENIVNVMSMAMKSFLDSNAKNPSRPTRAEFEAGYQTIKEVYNAIREEASRDALKNAATTHIPATGTGKGAPPAGKATRNERDRIMDIAGSI